MTANDARAMLIEARNLVHLQRELTMKADRACVELAGGGDIGKPSEIQQVLSAIVVGSASLSDYERVLDEAGDLADSPSSPKRVSVKDPMKFGKNRLTYSVAEAAEVLGIAKSSTYNAVRDGTLPTIRVGGRVLIPKIAVMKFLGIEVESEIDP